MQQPVEQGRDFFRRVKTAGHDRREEISRELVRLQNVIPLSVLLEALDDDSADVRLYALLALSMSSLSDSKPAVRALVRRLRSDPSPQVAAACADMLKPSHGRHAKRALLDGLRHPDPGVKAAACRAFDAQHCSRVPNEVKALLDDPDWSVRLTACRVLAGHWDRDPRLIDAIDRFKDDAGYAEYAARVNGTHSMVEEALADPLLLTERAQSRAVSEETLRDELEGAHRLMRASSPDLASQRMEELSTRARIAASRSWPERLAYACRRRFIAGWVE